MNCSTCQFLYSNRLSNNYFQVYFAEFTDLKGDKSRSQRLACKIVNGNAVPRDFLRRFFPREIEVMSKINHQNVIRIHSILQRQQRYFLFMQFCDQGDLLDFIRTNGALREPQAKIWFCQAIKGTYLK